VKTKTISNNLNVFWFNGEIKTRIKKTFETQTRTHTHTNT